MAGSEFSGITDSWVDSLSGGEGVRLGTGDSSNAKGGSIDVL